MFYFIFVSHSLVMMNHFLGLRLQLPVKQFLSGINISQAFDLKVGILSSQWGTHQVLSLGACALVRLLWLQ